MDKIPCRVLLVDDAKSDHAIIGRHLRAAQSSAFSLFCCTSFDAALQMLGSSSYDVCLIDYSLGSNRTGLDLIDLVASQPRATPIIFLTGLGNLEVAFEAMRRGAIEYLDKNALTSILLERTIRYAIENFRVREALHRANEELEARVEQRTEALVRSNQELERFAYVVSHELQMPLKTVVTYLDEMADRESTTEQAKSFQEDEFSAYFLHKAQASVRRMLAMIQNVLNYSRIAKQSKSMETASLKDVVESVLFDLSAEIDEKKARIVVSELPLVQGQAGLLHQVFKNLISNSLKFTRDRTPRIRVEIEQREGHWECGIHDNGLGIPPEDHEKVFLMFHRGESPSQHSGDGIGLAICRRIVELHGGRIWIESVPGKGSSFYFTLNPAPVSLGRGDGAGAVKPSNGTPRLTPPEMHSDEVNDHV